VSSGVLAAGSCHTANSKVESIELIVREYKEKCLRENTGFSQAGVEVKMITNLEISIGGASATGFYNPVAR